MGGTASCARSDFSREAAAWRGAALSRGSSIVLQQAAPENVCWSATSQRIRRASFSGRLVRSLKAGSQDQSIEEATVRMYNDTPNGSPSSRVARLIPRLLAPGSSPRPPFTLASAHHARRRLRNTVSQVPNQTERADQKRRVEIAPGIGAAMTEMPPRRSPARLASSQVADSQASLTESASLSFLSAGDVRTPETRPEQ